MQAQWQLMNPVPPVRIDGNDSQPVGTGREGRILTTQSKRSMACGDATIDSFVARRARHGRWAAFTT